MSTSAAMYSAYPPPSEAAQRHHEAMLAFMREEVLPAEPVYERQREEAGSADTSAPPVIEELKAKARERGLWNLFLPSESGLTQLEYATIAELSGWSMELAPEAINCAAPDTGNMELLHLVGTDQQQEEWLRPLLEGEIRSAFAMTEPAVASSDATNIETRIERDGDEYVVNGRKWWTSGAADPRCRVLIVMGKTDPDAATHRQQSMLIVPTDTPGVEIGRNLPVFGHLDQHGHCEVRFTDVRVPVANLLGEEGGGFANAQARLGPGRIHHVMRALGAGERALALMVARSQQRHAFGGALAEQSAVRERIAESRVDLEQARALCHRAAARRRQRRQQGRPPPHRGRQDRRPAGGLRGDRPGHPAPRRRRRHRRHRAEQALRLAPRDADLRRPRRGAPDHARAGRAHQIAGVRPARGVVQPVPGRGVPPGRVVRALVCHDGELDVADVVDPSPSRGQLVLDVLACGICGSDLHARRHCDELAEDVAATGYDDFMRSGERVVMGHEFCGEVVEGGLGTRTKPGTTVVAMPLLRADDGVHLVGLTTKAPGAYAEQVTVQESLSFAVPNGLPADAAALTEPMAVALHAVRRGEVGKRQPAIVIGCGPIGLGVIAMLKASGVRHVVASDYSPGRRALAAAMGADVVVDPAVDSPYDLPRPLTAAGVLELAVGTMEKLRAVPFLPWQHVFKAADAVGAAPSGPVVFECVGRPRCPRAGDGGRAAVLPHRRGRRLHGRGPDPALLRHQQGARPAVLPLLHARGVPPGAAAARRRQGRPAPAGHRHRRARRRRGGLRRAGQPRGAREDPRRPACGGVGDPIGGMTPS